MATDVRHAILFVVVQVDTERRCLKVPATTGTNRDSTTEGICCSSLQLVLGNVGWCFGVPQCNHSATIYQHG